MGLLNDKHIGLSLILRRLQVLAVAQPILQCVQVKPLAGQQGNPERFRVVFSDINNFVQSMLATRKSVLGSKSQMQTFVISLG